MNTYPYILVASLSPRGMLGLLIFANLTFLYIWTEFIQVPGFLLFNISSLPPFF